MPVVLDDRGGKFFNQPVDPVLSLALAVPDQDFSLVVRLNDRPLRTRRVDEQSEPVIADISQY